LLSITLKCVAGKQSDPIKRRTLKNLFRLVKSSISY